MCRRACGTSSKLVKWSLDMTIEVNGHNIELGVEPED